MTHHEDDRPTPWATVAIATIGRPRERRLTVDPASDDALAAAAAESRRENRVDEEMLALAIREAQRRLAGQEARDPILEYALATHGRAMLAVVRAGGDLVSASFRILPDGAPSETDVDRLVREARAGITPHHDLRPHLVDGVAFPWG